MSIYQYLHISKVLSMQMYASVQFHKMFLMRFCFCYQTELRNLKELHKLANG